MVFDTAVSNALFAVCAKKQINHGKGICWHSQKECLTSTLVLHVDTHFFTWNRDRLADQPDGAETKQDPLAEGFKVVVPISNTLEHLDIVVQTFSRAIGLAELPGVVDLDAPMVDTFRKKGDLGYGRSGILVDPIDQSSTPVNRRRFIAENVEVLYGIICFHQLGEPME